MRNLSLLSEKNKASEIGKRETDLSTVDFAFFFGWEGFGFAGERTSVKLSKSG